MGQKQFKVSNKKMSLLTFEFLKSLKDELVLRSKENNKFRSREIGDYENLSYVDYYGYLEGTDMFAEALKVVCKKYNVSHAIYDYWKKLTWDLSDDFESKIMAKMIECGIIDFSNENGDKYLSDPEEFLDANCKIQKRYEDYTVYTYEKWFSSDKSKLEEIYKDSVYEIIWLD